MVLMRHLTGHHRRAPEKYSGGGAAAVALAASAKLWWEAVAGNRTSGATGRARDGCRDGYDKSDVSDAINVRDCSHLNPALESLLVETVCN